MPGSFLDGDRAHGATAAGAPDLDEQRALESDRQGRDDHRREFAQLAQLDIDTVEKLATYMNVLWKNFAATAPRKSESMRSSLGVV